MMQSSRATANILLAEDEPGIMYTFKTILEEAGFQVESAPTFQKAQRSIEHNDYDAIITEFSLGREGLGLELVRQAKKLARAPAVVMYSGYPTVDRLRAALALGVDYFAFKPVDLDEIKTALFRLVARRADSAPLPAG